MNRANPASRANPVGRTNPGSLAIPASLGSRVNPANRISPVNQMTRGRGILANLVNPGMKSRILAFQCQLPRLPGVPGYYFDRC